MKIKGKIKKDNSFEMDTPPDNHAHCARTVDGEHRFMDMVMVETRPFLYFFQTRRLKAKTVNCAACGIVKEVYGSL